MFTLWTYDLLLSSRASHWNYILSTLTKETLNDLILVSVQLNKAVFDSSEEEAKDNQAIYQANKLE